MRTVIINDKAYQFSFDKFDLLFHNWKEEEHDGLSMKKFLYTHLQITKDSFYNYRHRRNGMDTENIKKFAELLGISVMDLMEEKVANDERSVELKINMGNDILRVSEFSKMKIWETLNTIEECIFSFFATFDVEDEFFDVMEALRKNEIAIPDILMDEISYFVYGALDELIGNPDDIFEQLPPAGDTVESIRARNRKLNDIQDEFMCEFFNPLKEKVKSILISP